jgi:trans-2,3-dihydro-3-hydroxyanthranilate isomerase
MSHRYYIADVFTNQAFSGAQIAVFPEVEASLTDSQMQAIASELNLSETVFVAKMAENKYEMRVFSPFGEVDFAGHPIIATAYVLAEVGSIDLTATFTPLVFKQNVGDIEVFVTIDEGKATFAQFSRVVSSVVDRFTPSTAEIAKMLSINETDIDSLKFSPRLVSCGFPYLVVPVWNYDAVRNATFNYSAWSHSSAPQTAAEQILLFSTKTPFTDTNFNLRLVGPNIGINDDPPVGSAIPAFASYLCSFDSTLKGTHSLTVDRGDKQRRRSVLNIEMDNNATSELELRIGGEAVIIAKGEFLAI